MFLLSSFARFASIFQLLIASAWPTNNNLMSLIFNFIVNLADFVVS